MPFPVKRLFCLLLILFPLVIFFCTPALGQVEEEEANEEKRVYGTFTIGPGGETLVFFPQAAVTLGMGQIAKGEVPAKVIEQMAAVSEIQNAVFAAVKARELCIEAREDADKGLISVATADLYCALADQKAANAELAWAGAWVSTNPQGDMYQDVVSREQSNLEAAEALEASALAAGGQLAQLEGYTGETRTAIGDIDRTKGELSPQLRGLPPRGLSDLGPATPEKPGTSVFD